MESCNTLTELAKLDTKLDRNHLSLRSLTLGLRPEKLFHKSWTETAKQKARKLDFFWTVNDCWFAVLVKLTETSLHVLGYMYVLDKQSRLIQCTCCSYGFSLVIPVISHVTAMRSDGTFECHVKMSSVVYDKLPVVDLFSFPQTLHMPTVETSSQML